MFVDRLVRMGLANIFQIYLGYNKAELISLYFLKSFWIDHSYAYMLSVPSRAML